MSLQYDRPSFHMMGLKDFETAERFQQEVALLLNLPPGSGDDGVRKALLKKGGPDYLTWYDTRLQAIAESNSFNSP
jgi:hypothetical protein